MWFNHQALTAAGQVLELLGVTLIAYQQFYPDATDRSPNHARIFTGVGLFSLMAGLAIEIAAGLIFPP